MSDSGNPGDQQTATALEGELDGRAGSAASGDARAPAGGELHRGATLGRYVVLERLGAGAMGVVYSAYDPELDRKVAVKLLLPGAARLGSTARGRLLREAQAMARVGHPNVVAVHDVGVLHDSIYVAMEFVAGQTLRAWLSQRARGWREIVALFVQAGRGLAAAHAEGLVHRDFKPDNVMVDASGRARVMDFGLARAIGGASTDDPMAAEESLPTGSRSSASNTDLTGAGAILGTPAYMAPEQFSGLAVDARTDQFSYCVALWEALLGARPFSGDNVVELAYSVVHDERRPPPKGRRVPNWLRRVVERGLRVRADERWRDMASLLDVLARRSRRRGWTWAAAGVVGSALALAGVAWANARAQLCSGASDRIEDAWNDDRRDAVQAALLATGKPYAPQAWVRIGNALDEWSTAWVRAHTEACEATRLRGEQSESVMDLRMACLQRGWMALDATVDVLQAATADAVDNAHQIVGGLPRLERCDDVDALLADIEPPQPEEAEGVDAIRSELAHAKALRSAGDYPGAMAAARRAEDATETIAYQPVRAEVSLELGFIHDNSGDYPAAEQALRQAQDLAARSRHWACASEATVTLVAIIGSAQGRYAEALALGDLALGMASGTPETEAVARNAIAAVFRVAGRLEEAEEHQRTAVRLWSDLHGPEHPDVALARSNLAVILDKRGRHAEAEAEHRAALAVFERELGAEHPYVATSHNNLGMVLEAEDKLEEAEAEHRAALASWLQSLGPTHPNIAVVRTNLAMVLQARGMLVEAEQEQREALALWKAAAGAKHPHVGTAHNNLGIALESQGKFPEAEAEYRAAIALWSEVFGEDHVNVGLGRKNLSSVLEKQDRDVEAEAERRDALTILGKHLGPAHPHVCSITAALGRLLADRSRTREAIELLEAARATCEPDATKTQLAELDFALGRALWAVSAERQRARTLATSALEAYAGAGARYAKDRARVEAWLGERE